MQFLLGYKYPAVQLRFEHLQRRADDGQPIGGGTRSIPSRPRQNNDMQTVVAVVVAAFSSVVTFQLRFGYNSLIWLHFGCTTVTFRIYYRYISLEIADGGQSISGRTRSIL